MADNKKGSALATDPIFTPSGEFVLRAFMALIGYSEYTTSFQEIEGSVIILSSR